jgi:3-deoxy-D-manno-octulosonic-acid transferase
MEGEEAAVLAAYRAALRENPRLRLILVPRHKERFDAVATMLKSAGVAVRRRSERTPPSATKGGPTVILVDTIGELSAVWGLADLAFVGGSLFPGRGGQNMMEPAAFGASVMFGPHTHNFKDAVEGLLACHGARRVASPAELSSALREDLRDPEAANTRALAGREFVLAQHGAAARTVVELERLVSSTMPLALVGSR